MPLSDEEAANLTQEFERERLELELAQKKRREEATAAARNAESAANKAAMKMEAMLELQQEADEKRENRRQWWIKYVITPFLGVALGGGGIGGYTVATAPEKTDAEDVEQALHERVNNLEQRQQAYGNWLKRLGDLHYERVKLILESNDKITERQDKILERLNVKLSEAEKLEPQTVSQARTAVQRYENRKMREHRGSFEDMGDAFADLPQPAPFEPVATKPKE